MLADNEKILKEIAVANADNESVLKQIKTIVETERAEEKRRIEEINAIKKAYTEKMIFGADGETGTEEPPIEDTKDEPINIDNLFDRVESEV